MPVPRRFDRRPPERDPTRLNERIRVPQVRLIGSDGQQVGIIATEEALQRAQAEDLDLVEVAPEAKPPVARLLDYSKYKYEQEQKQKAARKHQQQVNVREIKLRPKIADHDYNTKKGHVERFLRSLDKVKVTIMFRGREQAHPERGRALLRRLFEDLDELAVIESEPLQEGRNMSMLLAPSRAAAREKQAADQAAGDGGKAEAEATAEQPEAAESEAPEAEQREAAESEAPEAEEPEAPEAEEPEAPEAEEPEAPEAEEPEAAEQTETEEKQVKAE